jgi:hypothetical protein
VQVLRWVNADANITNSQPVVVLQDYDPTPGATNEGPAMCQIVYDIRLRGTGQLGSKLTAVSDNQARFRRYSTNLHTYRAWPNEYEQFVFSFGGNVAIR